MTGQATRIYNSSIPRNTSYLWSSLYPLAIPLLPCSKRLGASCPTLPSNPWYERSCKNWPVDECQLVKRMHGIVLKLVTIPAALSESLDTALSWFRRITVDKPESSSKTVGISAIPALSALCLPYFIANDIRPYRFAWRYFPVMVEKIGWSGSSSS